MRIPFQSLIEQITETAIVILDSEGIIQSWNAGAHKITGYSAREAVGRSLTLVLEDSVVTDLVTAGRPSAQGWLKRKQGRRVWTRNVVQRVRLQSGRAQALCWLCQDPFEAETDRA